MLLFAAGSNGSGQLAIGHQEDTPTFTATQFHPSVQHLLPNSTIVDLVSSSTHALLLLRTRPSHPGGQEEHILLGAGTNTLGQLGPKCLLWEGARPETRWKPVDFLSGLGKGGHEQWEAAKIGVTWTTSFVVYRRRCRGIDGGGVGRDDAPEEMLVSCGSNDFGELGRKDFEDDNDGMPSDLPTIVDLGLRAGEKVELLRGGQRHVIVVISGADGQRVVGWGASRKGELDISTLDSSPFPVSNKSPTPEGASGKTEDGRSKGKGKSASVPSSGRAPTRQPYLPPTPLSLPLPLSLHIIDVRLGASHTLALLSAGTIFAWGSDAKGQIGVLHSITQAVGIASTWGGSYILRRPSGPGKTYDLLSQGASSHSQLLRPTDNGSPARASVVLPDGAQVEGITAGSEHLMVHLRRTTSVEIEDELWVGGWNEHGNLGLGDTEDRGALSQADFGSFAGMDSEEGRKRRIRGIWGGCGSSWVWVE